MDDTLLIDTVEFYLRQDARLKLAGLEPLAEQPAWAEEIVWLYAAEAAERLARLRARAARAPVEAPARLPDRFEAKHRPLA